MEEQNLQQPIEESGKQNIKKVSKKGLIISWILGAVLTLPGIYFIFNPGDDLGALLVGFIGMFMTVIGLIFLGSATITQIRYYQERKFIENKKTSKTAYIVLIIILLIGFILLFFLPL